MTRFHINPNTGDPGPCKARVSCPYGNLETDHFDSKKEAREAYEAGKLDQAFSTLSKALDETVDPMLAGIEKAGWLKFEKVENPPFHGQTMHKVGELTVSSRKYDSENLDGSYTKIMETMVFDDQGEEYVTYATPDLSPEAVEAQHAKALAWAAENQPANLPENTGLTDETMQEMDEYYKDHPALSYETDKDGFNQVYANGKLVLSTKGESLVRTMTSVAQVGEWRAVQNSSNPMALSYVDTLVEGSEEELKAHRELNLDTYNPEQLVFNDVASKIRAWRLEQESYEDFYPEDEPPF